jgi:NAD(P)-dependent dehydrogenase (short-subunit alcohol dehydrogenase family)
VSGRLEGRTALITGGAGSIGLASAKAMVAEGARVFLVDVEESALERAVAEIGGELAGHAVADVTDAAAVERAVHAAVDRFGSLEIAFANAGVFGTIAPVAEYPDDVFEAVMRVNVFGVFLVVKHALRVMKRGGSVIINSSVVGLMSDARIAAYATSKHALVGLMRTAAKEMAPAGIRVNTIHPGPTANAFQTAIEVEAVGASPEDSAAAFEQMIPLGRHASPEEIARVVAFLASDDSAFMTGATVAVDGGLTI